MHHHRPTNDQIRRSPEHSGVFLGKKQRHLLTLGAAQQQQQQRGEQDLHDVGWYGKEPPALGLLYCGRALPWV